MKLVVRRRIIYDDVALLTSEDPGAAQWRLEVRGSESARWTPVPALIRDATANWSSADLAAWSALRRNNPSAIQQAFPDASSVVPASGPFTVTWDVSTWYPWADVASDERPRFRFVAPDGTTVELGLEALATGSLESR